MANHLSIEKKKKIFHLLCEGNGVRSITRILGCSKAAVSELQKRYSHIVDFINRKYITDLTIDEIEADELRTFVARKDNIRWIYVAMDRRSRLVIHYHIGKRDTEDAKIFLAGLSFKLHAKSKVSTDCLSSYVSAVKRTPNGRIEAATSSIGLLRSNSSDTFPRSITNKIESHNGNIRQHVSKLIRKTRCFAKKEESLKQHLNLFFFYYNFIKVHRALKATPALVLGITDEAYWENKLLEYDMLFMEQVKSTDSQRTYGRAANPIKVVSIGEAEKREFINDFGAIGELKIGTKRGPYKKKAKVVAL